MKIQAYDAYSQIASGNRITSASKDPAGLAISEKLNSQIKSEEKAISNIETGQDLLNTAEGSLNSISEDLGRVRELAVQASNGILTSEDKDIIQNEINSLLENIETTAQDTEFNTIKLLDGSFNDINLGAGANGQGTIMSIENSSLEALGLDNFSLDASSLDTIDQAIEQVSTARAEIGAQTNGLESNLNNTRISAENQTAARSTIADTDIAKAVMQLNKQKVMSQYQNMIQEKQVDQEKNQLGLLI